MTEYKLHRIGRVDQIVRDYFTKHTENEILAKDLMPLFIEKGIFKKDSKCGLPIRNLLREMDAANKLDLLKHVKVIRKTINRSWYFIKK